MNARQQHSRVVAVIGSPHRRGNTVALVEAALEELERCGCSCVRIALAELHIAGCDGHENCGELAACPQDDDMAGVLEAVYGADGLILASPVYYENVSGQMKTFIDRNATRYYHDEWLAPKIAGLIAVAMESGLEETLGAMRRFLALFEPARGARAQPGRLRGQARRRRRQRATHGRGAGAGPRHGGEARAQPRLSTGSLRTLSSGAYSFCTPNVSRRRRIEPHSGRPEPRSPRRKPAHSLEGPTQAESGGCAVPNRWFDSSRGHHNTDVRTNDGALRRRFAFCWSATSTRPPRLLEM